MAASAKPIECMRPTLFQLYISDGADDAKQNKLFDQDDHCDLFIIIILNLIRSHFGSRHLGSIHTFAMPLGGGIRKRLGISQDAEAPAPDADASASSSAAAAPRGGIRRRVAKSEDAPAASAPLTDSLKRDWAIGKLSSVQVKHFWRNNKYIFLKQLNNNKLNLNYKTK